MLEELVSLVVISIKQEEPQFLNIARVDPNLDGLSKFGSVWELIKIMLRVRVNIRSA